MKNKRQCTAVLQVIATLFLVSRTLFPDHRQDGINFRFKLTYRF